MNTRWRKIAGDFREHRSEIACIALVLIVGASGVIAALNARAVLAREIAKSYSAANSPDIILWFERVDAALVEQVRARPGVAAAEARRSAFTRAAADSGDWFTARVTVLPDVVHQQVGSIHQHGSDGTPREGIFIEQSGQSLLGRNVGDELQVRTPAGEVVRVPIAGLVHDTAVAPSTQDRVIYAYVTAPNATRIGLNPEADQLLVKMKARESMSDVYELSEDLTAWLKAHDATPLRADAQANTHPHAALMSTMLAVLEVLAGIAFACSAALASYMISLWMKREVRQVGIMKAIGARFSQIALQYLALLAPVVVVSVLVALPLGTLLTRAVVRYYETSLNIDVADWSAPTTLLVREIVFALLIPFVAMALPIVRAARVSARRAIQDSGIVPPSVATRITARIIAVPMSRRMTFALRNTFRRPWRLALTLLALSAGGALLLTSYNTYESLMRVVDVSLAQQGHDLEVQLQKPAPAGEIEAIAHSVQGVEIAEAFRRAAVNVDEHRVSLCGYPADTRLLILPIKEGAWPRADETNSVVINRTFQSSSAALHVGSELTVKFHEREQRVRIVGIVEEIGAPTIYAPFPTFDTITALGDASQSVRVKVTPGHERSVVNALDQALLNAHLTPSLIGTRAEFRTALDEHFAVVTTVMKMIALGAMLIGAISLVASVSLGVIERSREIGVIRALGATPRNVMAIFVAEGGAVALLSALIAIALSLYLAQLLNHKAANELLHVAVPLYVSRFGLGILFSGVFAVMLGVWLSVRRLLRLSVHEALAYE
ncbi:MAG: FtsX-like permease family protein [Chthoniobacterales bacterium]